MTDPSQRRHVLLQAAHNFRDLGGYWTSDGLCVRRCALFRSDSLQDLTDTDIRKLRDDLGVTTVVDLRTEDEVRVEGQGGVSEGPVRYVNLPIDAESRGPTEYIASIMEDLVARYRSYLVASGPSIARLIELAGDPANHPLVFYCAAGKDRTGVSASIMLSALRVPRESIVSDYAATADHMGPILARLRRRPSYARLIRDYPDTVFEARRETMWAFLTRMDEEWGSPVDWLRSVGVGREAIRNLRQALLVSPQHVTKS